MRLATLPDKEREAVIERLESSLARARAGETQGIVIFEVVDKETFKIGWAGIGSTYSAVGMLEEAKHQLLAGCDGPPEWVE